MYIKNGEVYRNFEKNWHFSDKGHKLLHILYSRKIWQGIKFGGLAVYITTAKLKSAKIFY